MRGETGLPEEAVQQVVISIHSPHAGRDLAMSISKAVFVISIHSPHAGRDALFPPLK